MIAQVYVSDRRDRPVGSRKAALILHVAHSLIAGAIPEDLAREEQERITKELGHAERVLATSQIVYSQIEETPELVLDQPGRCEEVYRLGATDVRRLSNQLLFENLWIDVEYDEPAPLRAGLNYASLSPPSTVWPATQRTSTVFLTIEVRRRSPCCARQSSNLPPTD
ncbi:hypothetical protein [Kribbella sp. NPDC051718]|uniref:hypothetical protein n=1 Tax=Kribbella sp. NPDC051718 TaxID=3155168 RepID=UPI003440C2F7